MANKYGNMHSFEKMHAENSVMKKMSHKKRYIAEFFCYIMIITFVVVNGFQWNLAKKVSSKGHGTSFTTTIMH